MKVFSLDIVTIFLVSGIREMFAHLRVSVIPLLATLVALHFTPVSKSVVVSD